MKQGKRDSQIEFSSKMVIYSIGVILLGLVYLIVTQ